MDELQVRLQVYSPRWGHEDGYTVSFKQDEMRITHCTATKFAVCTQLRGEDPVWSGYGSPAGNPLMNIFRNDQIFAPVIVPFAMEWAWQQWRDGEASPEVVRAGLEELFAWIDSTARGKPHSELWDAAF